MAILFCLLHPGIDILNKWCNENNHIISYYKSNTTSLFLILINIFPIQMKIYFLIYSMKNYSILGMRKMWLAMYALFCFYFLFFQSYNYGSNVDIRMIYFCRNPIILPLSFNGSKLILWIKCCHSTSPRSYSF